LCKQFGVSCHTIFCQLVKGGSNLPQV
jgi:hypothetical protein